MLIKISWDIVKMHNLLVLASVFLSAASLEDDLQVHLQNNVYLIGNNATFRCNILRNTSDGLRLIDGPEKIEWSFKPVGSNTSVFILTPEQNNSKLLSVDGSENENSGTGNNGDDTNLIKYHREVWLDMTICNVDATDAGTYSCRLVDKGLSASAELYVIDTSPICTMSDSGPIYYAGDNVTLTCTMGFHGNQVPRLDWELPKLHVDYEHLTYQQENTATMLSSSVNLKLQHMIDGKLFQCAASFINSNSKFTCETMFPPESVQYPPFITHLSTYPHTEEHNHQVSEGSNLTLYCTAHGRPTPTWTWKFVAQLSETENILPCHSETCSLKWLRQKDSGSYTCTVSNTIKGQDHSDSTSIFLKVTGGKPVYRTTTALPMVTEYIKDKGVSPYAIGAIVCASLAIILIVVFIFLAMKMKSRERRMHERMTRMHDENLDDQEAVLLDENLQPDNSDTLPVEYGRLKQQWEIARKDIRLVDLIAKGTFVEVWRGRMRKYPRRNEIMKVAIKRIVAEASEKERRFFLAELEVMKAIQPHPNILPLIGCYTANDPWLVMVEYAVEGSLYQYLQHRRPGDLRVEISSDSPNSVSIQNGNLTAHKLLSLAAQVVNGLQHLSRFKMVYYRLRAASVLVCKGGVCKLSGFGFTQDITERNLYEANSLPLRWMSPECLLENCFTVKSDIWSFGILLWEIVHFGHLPYPDMGPHEVMEKIQNGYRMSQPPHCSGDIYNLMLMCWAENPDNRPSYGDIMQNLHHLSEHAGTHINIDKLPEGLRSADILENPNAVA